MDNEIKNRDLKISKIFKNLKNYDWSLLKADKLNHFCEQFSPVSKPNLGTIKTLGIYWPLLQNWPQLEIIDKGLSAVKYDLPKKKKKGIFGLLISSFSKNTF